MDAPFPPRKTCQTKKFLFWTNTIHAWRRIDLPFRHGRFEQNKGITDYSFSNKNHVYYKQNEFDDGPYPIYAPAYCTCGKVTLLRTSYKVTLLWETNPFDSREEALSFVTKLAKKQFGDNNETE